MPRDLETTCETCVLLLGVSEQGRACPRKPDLQTRTIPCSQNHAAGRLALPLAMPEPWPGPAAPLLGGIDRGRVDEGVAGRDVRVRGVLA